MENSTHFNNFSYTIRRGIWINDFVFSCVLLMVSVYLSVALVYHKIKIEKPLKAKFFRLTLEKKYRVMSKYICIFIGIFSLIRCVSDIGVNSLEWKTVFSYQSVQATAVDTIACNVLSQVSASAIYFGNVFVYVFLWLRQSIFYVQSTLKVLYNKKLKAFSFFILIFYLVLGITLFLAYSIFVQYSLNSAGLCQFQVTTNNNALFVQILTSWNILSIVMQILVLSLFIYPLLKQTSWKLNQQGKQNHHMLRVVKKAVVLTSVSLVTDICTLLSLRLVVSDDSNNPTFLYDVNLVINHLVTIACFGFWRKLLWPWSIKCHITINTVMTVDDTLNSSQQRINTKYL